MPRFALDMSRITARSYEVDVETTDRDTKNENIISFRLTIDQIQKEMKYIIEKNSSLMTNDQVNSMECELNLLSPFQTIVCTNALGSALASNNRCLLMDQRVHLHVFDQDLILLKQFRWKYGLIRQICWSSTLGKFIVTTNKNRVYLVNENITSIECLHTLEEQDWCSCTCSETALFLTTNSQGSNVFQVNLLAQFELIQQWKSPQSCLEHELIHNIVYNNQSIAFIIENCLSHLINIELRSSVNLDRIWTFQSDIPCHPCSTAIRCCSLKCDQWLVTDSSSLLQITDDGKMKHSYKYKSSPWNVLLFRPNIIAVRTEYSLNFHRLS